MESIQYSVTSEYIQDGINVKIRRPIMSDDDYKTVCQKITQEFVKAMAD